MDEEISDGSKTWVGSDISELCLGKGPWSFIVTPVNISKYHAVLYELPVTLDEPPKPHESVQPKLWDDEHVRMPFSEKNLFPITENGINVIKLRWNIIKDTFSKPITNGDELEAAIRSYNSNLPKLEALHRFLEEVSGEEEIDFFFTDVLPKIVKLALALPELVPAGIPLLRKNHCRSVSLSQAQIASLLANAFLCTFPWRKDVANTFPGVNFVRLFAAHGRPDRENSIMEKLKCIVHYFLVVAAAVPVGVVTFERKFIPKADMPRWDMLDSDLGSTKIHVDSSGTIEDNGLGFLQVDFANKNVGGGVLGYGCVQEEIRFVICPELLISRLFVEQLGDQEAVIVTGVERYSKYKGYGDSFEYDGNFIDETPHDEYGRRRTTVCIIDAIRFNKPRDQFRPSAMLRELNKAYVGFSSRQKCNLAPVATGNWGCGAFRGSAYLKALLQLMACCAAGRNLVYYSFGDEELRRDFHGIYQFLSEKGVTIKQLWRILCGFSPSGFSDTSLYLFIQQTYITQKKEPVIEKLVENKNGHCSSSQNKTVFKKQECEPSTSFQGRRNGDEIREEKIDFTKTNDMEIDDDIIDATPPEEIKFKKKQTKKAKMSEKEVLEKMPKTNIMELIDRIDGNTNNNHKEGHQEESFLSKLDSFKKTGKGRVVGKTECSTNDNTISNQDTFKIPKTKISQYFTSKPTKPS
ncbi:unnamed protein product [Phaedon cochleariae]|uniref:poly(ADP-ribose) glycohydrolase n=1 Tax=Phaedon cochleariae TaxID=80249 RepID=A0A9P0GWA5_PHACE|nr:unnamed protein product [Phaedon cochleariae]